MAGAAALAAETCKYHITPMGQNVRSWGGLVSLRVETFGKWGKEAQGVFTRLASHLQAGVCCPHLCPHHNSNHCLVSLLPYSSFRVLHPEPPLVLRQGAPSSSAIPGGTQSLTVRFTGINNHQTTIEKGLLGREMFGVDVPSMWISLLSGCRSRVLLFAYVVTR
ncbi:hypothetical protein EMCRGX_G035057 [Ephydatia muelleri]